MQTTHGIRSVVIGKMMLFLAAFAACFTAQCVIGGGLCKALATEYLRVEIENSRLSGQERRGAPLLRPMVDEDVLERFIRQLRSTRNMEERRRIIRALKEWMKNHLAPVFRYELKQEHLQYHKPPQVKVPRRMKTSRSKISSTDTVYHVPFASVGNRLAFFIYGSEVGHSKGARVTPVSAPAWFHCSGNGQIVESQDTAAGPVSIRFDFSVDRTAPVGKETEMTIAFLGPAGESFQQKLRVIVDPPARFELFQNFPNPFNPTTTLSFVISYSSFVKLAVYDPLGREVAMLANEVKQPGQYSVRWNAGLLPSGVYFYRLRAGAFAETKKLVLMR